MDYVCCGGLRIDYLITPDGQAHVREMGGNALYAAVGARVWSDHVGLLARVGENYPTGWLDALQQRDLDVSGIRVVPGRQDMRTFYAYTDPRTRTDTNPATHFAGIGLPLPDDLADYVHSTPGQDNPDEYEPLAVRPDDWPSAYDGACALHLSPISIRTHTNLPTRARQSGVAQITADPGERYMVPRLRSHVEVLLQNLDVFLPSEMEVRSLMTEGVNVGDAAVEFARHGPRVVVIKLGDRGALMYERDSNRRTHVPPYPAHVVDVTGAGDSFCGGFMVGLATTGDPIRAALYGTVSASFAIEGYGALYALSANPAEARRRLVYLEQAISNIKSQISKGLPMTVDSRTAIFDRLARTWDELPAPPDAAERLARVVQAARLCAGDAVLDVGSGTGALLPALLEKRPRRLFAGDIAPEMLMRLRRKFADARVTPVVCDGARLPIRAGAFDAVFANAVLPHFEDKPAALAEFHRVAASGARLIISHIIGRQRVNEIHAASEDAVLRGDQVPTADEIVAMLRSAGWRVTEVEDSAGFYLVVAEKE